MESSAPLTGPRLDIGSRTGALPRMLLFTCFGLGAVAAIGLRFGSLAAQPLSFDEAASVYIARMPLVSVLQHNGAFNSSPPAMLALLHLALKIGQSEAFVRSVSVLAGVGAILAVYRIGRLLDPVRSCAGAIAALLFALSSQQIILSRQFRVYALGELFGALGLLAALEFSERQDWRRAAAVALAFFAGMQVQYALIPFFFSVGIALACSRLGARSSVRQRLGYLGLICGASIISLLVVYQTALRYQLYQGRGTSYSPTLHSSSSWLEGALFVLIATWKLIYSGLELAGGAWLALPLLAFCGYGLFHLAKRNHRDLYVFAALGSLAVFSLISLANYYPYGPVRQCSVLTLPFYAITAVGLVEAARHPRISVRVIAFACLALAPAGPLIKLMNGSGFAAAQPGDVREGMRTIRENWREGDVVFVPPGSFPQFDYYSTRTPMPKWIPGHGSMEWMQDERAWRPMISAEPPYADQLNTLISSGARVWVLYAHYHTGEMRFPQLADRRGWTNRVQTIMQAEGPEPGERNELYVIR